MPIRIISFGGLSATCLPPSEMAARRQELQPGYSGLRFTSVLLPILSGGAPGPYYPWPRGGYMEKLVKHQILYRF